MSVIRGQYVRNQREYDLARANGHGAGNADGIDRVHVSVRVVDSPGATVTVNVADVRACIGGVLEHD